MFLASTCIWKYWPQLTCVVACQSTCTSFARPQAEDQCRVIWSTPSSPHSSCGPLGTRCSWGGLDWTPASPAALSSKWHSRAVACSERDVYASGRASDCSHGSGMEWLWPLWCWTYILWADLSHLVWLSSSLGSRWFRRRFY